MASTKRGNCTRKRNYADGRKFRQKNHILTVVYVQRHAIKIQKPVLKCTALLRNMVKHDIRCRGPHLRYYSPSLASEC